MDLGITIHLTDQSIDIRELAVAVEERGFSSLWVPEHTHIPTSRATPQPGGGDLGDEYSRSPDPWVSLAVAAVVTEHLRIGSGVALVAQHHPINLAKVVATVDAISGGRTVVGVGFGWNREEMAHHGVDYITRRARVREHIEAMRTLWAEDEAQYHGEFVDFDSCWSWPVPSQPGGPPIMVGGGGGPRLFAEVAKWADGWLPIGGAGLRSGIENLQVACEAVGRDADEISIIPFGTLPTEGKLAHYDSLGVVETVLRVPSAGRDEVLRVLDEYTKFVGAERHSD